jgi:hypothetical protein
VDTSLTENEFDIKRDQVSHGNDHDPADLLPESLHDRLVSKLAARWTAIHFFVGFVVVGWYCFVVPYLKQLFDSSPVSPAPATLIMITLSDLLVNYWYVLLFIVPIALKIDFSLMRWIGKEIGTTDAIRFAYCIALFVLFSIAFGQYAIF